LICEGLDSSASGYDCSVAAEGNISMSGNMMQFVSIPPSMPNKRGPDQRKVDWKKPMKWRLAATTCRRCVGGSVRRTACEGNCVIEQSGHGTVTIGSVEKYIADTAFDMGWVRPVPPIQELDRSVGIIGAGPAGLACAEELRKHGYQVQIYDRHDRPAVC
jgi:hypothetical protein